jgi:hypothetical protein
MINEQLDVLRLGREGIQPVFTGPHASYRALKKVSI